jgi:hypothetical protein
LDGKLRAGGAVVCVSVRAFKSNVSAGLVGTDVLGVDEGIGEFLKESGPSV